MPPSRPCAVWTITALTRLKAQGMYKADAVKSSASSRIIFQPSDPGAQRVRLWSEWQAAGPARQPEQAPAPMLPASAGAGPPAPEAAVKAEADAAPAQAPRHLSSGAEQRTPEAQQYCGQGRESASAGGALQMAPAEQSRMAATCQIAALGTSVGQPQHTSARAPTQEPTMPLQADVDRKAADPTPAASSLPASMLQRHSSAPAKGLRSQQDRPDVNTAKERAEGMQGSAAEQSFSQASTVLFAANTQEHGPQLSLSHRHALTAFSQLQCTPCTEQLSGQPSHSSGAPCGQPLHSYGTSASALGQSHPVKHGSYALPKGLPGLVPLVCSSTGPSTPQVRMACQERAQLYPEDCGVRKFISCLLCISILW